LRKLAHDKSTVYALASELEVPVARISQEVKRQVPYHANLAILKPTSHLGPQLVEVIRLAVAEAPAVQFPHDPREIKWIG
jgi:hypothetical protein